VRLPYIRFYFRDHLGDTGHLTPQQHGIYFLLLANYAASGKPLPTDLTALCRLAHAVTASEQADVSMVLDFFTKDGDVYRQKRLDSEIERATRNHDRACELSAHGVKAREDKRVREFLQAELLAAEAENPPGEREKVAKRESPTPQDQPAAPANRTVNVTVHQSEAISEDNRTVNRTVEIESAGNAGVAGGGVTEALSIVGVAPLQPRSDNSKTNSKSKDEQRWDNFIKDTKGSLPDLMKWSKPKPESIPLILERANAQKAGHGVTKAEMFAMDVSDWAEGRSPSLEGLKCFRWEAFLKETEFTN
jgi:uncharacterized protein YdaU (DUF1376 family)